MPTSDQSRRVVTANRALHGKMPDGREVGVFQLSTPDGASLTVSEYGCRILSLRVPDAHGEIGEVTLGYDSLDAYLSDPFYLGAVVGRYANRINGGSITVAGQPVQLSVNENGNHLHGGVRGFSLQVWRGIIEDVDGLPSLRFELVSPDGDEGYPGELRVVARIQLLPSHEVVIRLEAETDKTTVVNLTTHPYFNLDGPGGDILDHRLTVPCGDIVPVTENMIPEGTLLSVPGTPFDLRVARRLGDVLAMSHPQLMRAGGIDQTWSCLDELGAPRELAVLTSPRSGRRLSLWTTAPGMHVYTGNFLAPWPGVAESLAPRAAVCLEPQAWPDSPNQASFPSTVLRPGEVYQHQIHYRFDTIGTGG